MTPCGVSVVAAYLGWVADLLALVAQGNGWPAGDGELAADVEALQQIGIAVP